MIPLTKYWMKCGTTLLPGRSLCFHETFPYEYPSIDDPPLQSFGRAPAAGVAGAHILPHFFDDSQQLGIFRHSIVLILGDQVDGAAADAIGVVGNRSQGSLSRGGSVIIVIRRLLYRHRYRRNRDIAQFGFHSLNIHGIHLYGVLYSLCQESRFTSGVSWKKNDTNQPTFQMMDTRQTSTR